MGAHKELWFEKTERGYSFDTASESWTIHIAGDTPGRVILQRSGAVYIQIGKGPQIKVPTEFVLKHGLEGSEDLLKEKMGVQHAEP